MIGRKVSHYRFIELVSEGGMGSVYKAQDLTLERTVAIKVLKPTRQKDKATANRRFIREAQIISQIDHPNVVTLLEVFRERDSYFLVMQFVDGSTLREIINNKRLDYREALHIAREVAKGLEAAHKHGIVHRDIKPENIMMTPSNQCKILDFGVAHLVDRSTITGKEKIVGTIPYMAPEQIQGAEVDARTDVHALGVLLFEMLSGKRPFDQEEEIALFYQVTNVDPPSLRSICHELPEGLENVVSRALAKNPEERYQSISELLHDLDVIESRSGTRSISSRERLLARTRKPAWTKAAIGVAILTTFAIAIVIRFWPSPKGLNGFPRIMVVKPINTAENKDLDWLSGGIMDGLIGALGRLEGYSVISRQTVSSAMEVLRSEIVGIRPMDIFDAARAVGANYLVTGSYVQSANTMRINCELNDVEKRVLVRSWTKDLKNFESELFSTIDYFAKRIAEAFATNLKEDSVAGVRLGSLLTQSLEALKYYQKALEFYEVGNRPAAVDNFKLAVSIDPTFTAAYLYLGEISLSRSEREEFLTMAMKYRTRSPSPLREIVEAEYLGFTNEVAKSIDKYESILARYPEEVFARIALADLYMGSRKFHNAVAEYSLLRKISPFDFSFYPNWWLAYVEIGRKDKALAILKDWRRQMPGEQRPLRELIAFHENVGEYEAAISLCDSIAALSLGSDLSFRGFLYLYLGRMRASEEIFNQLRNSPDRFISGGRAFSYLAYLYYRRKDPARGLQMIERALEKEDDTYNWWLAGLLSAQNGDFSRAERYAERIKSMLTRSPGDSTRPEALGYRRFYYHLKGSIALARKDPARAIKMHQRALEFSSLVDEAFFRTYLARAYLEAGEVRNAIRASERVLQLNHRYPEALLLLGQAYVILGEHQKARTVLKELERLWKQADSDFSGKRVLERLLALSAAR